MDGLSPDENVPAFTGVVRESARQLFAYGIRSYGIDLCGTMALYVDQALVVRLLEPGLMGTYVVALSLSRMLNAFHTSVVMVLFPKAVSCLPEEVAGMTSRAMRMSTMLATFAGIGIVALGPQVLSLLYGREYRGANVVLRILVVEVVLSGATLVLSQAFMALGRPGIITALQVTGLALTVPLMFLLIPRFGIAGAGIALLCSTIARLIFVLASFPIFSKCGCRTFCPNWRTCALRRMQSEKVWTVFGAGGWWQSRGRTDAASVEYFRASLLGLTYRPSADGDGLIGHGLIRAWPVRTSFYVAASRPNCAKAPPQHHALRDPS